uniref:Atlastinlike protein putative n=1 Tax=Albugo laibachii Nc14 TaxID=890382 RepID=F0WY98_9STRA|nr:atlastinlike protein putative [Albugo laibachii Nc14]|eukprot:CCA26450.1 atlastinlike protein putative [Albugo laibachii Nc14]
MDPMQTSQRPQASPRSRQIVSINEDGTRFTLDETALEEIFHQVPEDTKVAIYSVVGAFRTGKSFLLDLFLRYLRFGSDAPILSDTVNSNSDEWKKWIYSGVDSLKSGKNMLEGNSNFDLTNGSKGFSWRAGRKRNTTGIWMWEQAFLRKTESGEDVAVFLVDTQGMFDSETSQMLTASIFGLSTLLSSYQIYNVDKRVQEDNMQHLALFSEYGRMALFGHDETNRNIQALDSRCLSIRKTHSSVSTNEENASAGPENDKKKGSRPFQKLDFLVRDWQDFSRNQSLADKREDMKQYTDEILSIRTQKDLANTREQIFSCFEDVNCFLLPHPGHEVTEREYDGNVEAIDDRFLELVTAYLDDIFSPAKLAPKYIHGVPVTSRELLTFIRYYAALFRDSSIFPEAKTLLEATAEANNVNKREKALIKYKKEMESLVGLKSGYVPVAQLEKHHVACAEGAMAIFDQGANMGRQSQIRAHRSTLASELTKEYERFSSVNAERDPYKNLEFYLIPGAIAFALLAFRVGQDLFCYEHVGYDLPLYDCKHVSNTLTHLYWAIFIFMLLITISTGQVMFARIKAIVALVKTASQTEGKAKTE